LGAFCWLQVKASNPMQQTTIKTINFLYNVMSVKFGSPKGTRFHN
jgi:hypothetical protein